MCSFTCLELSELGLIFFEHQNCLSMPAGNPIPAKVQLTDIMQAPPQLCLLAVLEDPGVLFALCLECLGVLLLLGVSPLPSYSTFSSVQFSHLVMFDSLQPHGPQHARPPCPSPTPGVYSNSCPMSQ